MPTRLTDGEIETLVNRYREAMPRYEDAAALIESRLRRELRAAALKALLSSRAKHPDEVRSKLKRLRQREDPRATFENLETDLNRTVTDLAGARVVVYHPAQEAAAFDLLQRKFTISVMPNAIEVKTDRYRASHALVELDSSFERASVRGTIVEIQVTTVANHVFNELEHDIAYKTHGLEPTPAVRAYLEDVEHASRLLNGAVERLLDSRDASKEDTQRVISEPEELRHALERDVGRPLSGDFVRLLRLLDTVIAQLTPATLRELGDPRELIEKGRAQSKLDDDVVAYVAGLLPDFRREFQGTARSWRGPTTDLKRAILGDEAPE